MGDLFSYGLPGGIVPQQGQQSTSSYAIGGGPITQLLDPTDVDAGAKPGDANTFGKRSINLVDTRTPFMQTLEALALPMLGGMLTSPGDTFGQMFGQAPAAPGMAGFGSNNPAGNILQNMYGTSMGDMTGTDAAPGQGAPAFASPFADLLRLITNNPEITTDGAIPPTGGLPPGDPNVTDPPTIDVGGNVTGGTGGGGGGGGGTDTGTIDVNTDGGSAGGGTTGGGGGGGGIDPGIGIGGNELTVNSPIQSLLATLMQPMQGLANGGMLDPRIPTLVGEQGPELIMNGEVIPLQTAATGGTFTDGSAVPWTSAGDYYANHANWYQPGTAVTPQTGPAGAGYDPNVAPNAAPGPGQSFLPTLGGPATFGQFQANTPGAGYQDYMASQGGQDPFAAQAQPFQWNEHNLSNMDWSGVQPHAQNAWLQGQGQGLPTGGADPAQAGPQYQPQTQPTQPQPAPQGVAPQGAPPQGAPPQGTPPPGGVAPQNPATPPMTPPSTQPTGGGFGGQVQNPLGDVTQGGLVDSATPTDINQQFSGQYGGMQNIFQGLLGNNPEQQAFQQGSDLLSQNFFQQNPGQGMLDALEPVFQRNLNFGLGQMANRAPSVSNSAMALEGTDLSRQALQDFNVLGAQALQQGLNQQLSGLDTLGGLAGQAGMNPMQRALGVGQLGMTGRGQDYQNMQALTGLAQNQNQFASNFGLMQNQQQFNQTVLPALQLLQSLIPMLGPTGLQTVATGG